MQRIVLKVKGPGINFDLDINDCETVGKMRQLIAEKFGKGKEFDLLLGYPPTPITENDNVKLSNFVKVSDILRVQPKSLSGQQMKGNESIKQPNKRKRAQKPIEKVKSPIRTISAPSSNRSFLVTTGSSINRRNSSNNEPTPPAPKRRRKMNKSNEVTTENDISDHLISAVSGGTGNRSKMLRKVFRNAVSLQYDSSKAVARLSSIHGGKYEITESSNSRVLNSGASTQLNITFHKGSTGGKNSVYHESVELLPDDLLHEVVKAALSEDNQNFEGKEVLKPMNLAKCSPRIFWSLIYRYGNNIIETIKNILKDIDDKCEWLIERKKELSEKAKLNLEQKMEKEAKANERKRKQLEKNNKKLANNDIVSDNEGDNIEKHKSEIDPYIMKLLNEVNLDKIIPEEWQEAVYNLLNGKNKSALNFITLSLESEKICENISEKHENKIQLSVDQLDCWVENTKDVILYIIWSLICGGGSNRLRKVLRKLRIRNLEEILIWKNAPEGLLEGLISLDTGLKELRFNWCSEKIKEKHFINIEHINWMCEQSEVLLKEFNWLPSNYISITEEEGLIDNGENLKPHEKPTEGEDEEWITTPEENNVGRRVRLFVDREEGSNEGFFWEEGVIIGFLPPTEDEPMALWRVELDECDFEGISKSSTGKKDKVFEDLEEEEIQFSMELYDKMNGSN